MGFGKKNSSSDDNSSGLKEHLGAFVDKASAHARVRAELFMIEAKEAAEEATRMLEEKISTDFEEKSNSEKYNFLFFILHSCVFSEKYN